jgi:hypothetical protein
VTKPRYRPIQEDFTILPGQTLTRNWRLELQSFAWDFVTTPPGATVELDGRELGATPLGGVPVVPGSHRLSFRLPGHRPYEITRNLLLPARTDRGTTTVKLPFDLPARTIQIDGKADDWDAMETPEYQSLGTWPDADPLPKTSGNLIGRFLVCQDAQYIYWYMEFSDGQALFKDNLSYELAFMQHPDMWTRIVSLKLANTGKRSGKDWQPMITTNYPHGEATLTRWTGSPGNGDCRFGGNFVEARFPRDVVLGVDKETEYWGMAARSWVEGTKLTATESGRLYQLAAFE